MKIIGLAGLMASGKTTAAQFLAANGAYVIDGDKIGHNILKRDGAAYASVISIFGTDILDGSYEIDRRKLGAIVFSDMDKFSLLNEVTHPIIVNEIKRQIMSAPPSEFIVIDAIILLYDIGLREICDFWLFINADWGVRVSRIMERNNFDEDTAQKRAASQLFLERPEVLATASEIIYNNNEVKDLNVALEEVLLHVKNN
ncbi:MAG: dephospho-CoA kinase [Defluviitaleaceae bacterium]|nr:dephospho-CoA kinase [Defluviitaleaceae bacterium]